MKSLMFFIVFFAVLASIATAQESERNLTQKEKDSIFISSLADSANWIEVEAVYNPQPIYDSISNLNFEYYYRKWENKINGEFSAFTDSSEKKFASKKSMLEQYYEDWLRKIETWKKDPKK